MDAIDPRHGTANGYGNLRCRCQACRKAWADYHHAYLDRHPEQREKARERESARHNGGTVRPRLFWRV